jgi:membrane protease YdiL (CAAX protease family)
MSPEPDSSEPNLASGDRGSEPELPSPLRDRERTLFETVFLQRASQTAELRSGWRAGLYVAFFILIFSILNVATAFLQRRVPMQGGPAAGGQMTPGFLFRQELAMVASAILATLLMGALERRPFGAYGMPLRDAFRRRFWQGAVWGIAQISAVMFLIRAFNGYSFGALAIHGSELVRWGLLWGGFFVVVGITEEFLFRGYLQFTLTSGMGFWPAATLLSLGFGAVHLRNPGEGPVGAASVFAIGMLFCLTLRRTGNLWFAIGLHAAFDFGETFVYAVPDSGLVMPGQMLASSLHGPRWLTGGTIGPEGSALAFVVVGAVFVLFDRVYPRAQYMTERNEPLSGKSPSSNAPENPPLDTAT